ncbi:MAG: F0F1 ATP synthase subunit alpha [Bacillota bacterium]
MAKKEREISSKKRRRNPVSIVSTPIPLTSEEQLNMTERLKKIIKGNWEYRYMVNERLWTGFTVQYGDLLLDVSGRRYFHEISRRINSDIFVDEDLKTEKMLDELLEKVGYFHFDYAIYDVGNIVKVGDGVAVVEGLDRAMLGEVVRMTNYVDGMVLSLEEDSCGCILLGPEEKVHAGDLVRLTGDVMKVPVGESVIGRIVDPLGNPLDGKGPLIADTFRPVERGAPGIAERNPVNMPLQTGIKTIDALIPIGRGQRELIIGDRQTGKTAIAVDTILNQKNTGVLCFYVAIGQKMSTIANVVRKLEETGAMAYTTVVAASASDPAPMQYLAPYAGCTMAEEFMVHGRDALIVYDDLSKHAVAYRTLSLLLRRPPGREAYPGDIFYLHARLLERAARLKKGGSLTALPIVETLAGDISAYIPTNVISITDGQIFLESDLFYAGIRPAINVGLSVSRVGGDAQIKAMKEIAGPLRMSLAQYRELSTFAQFGAELDKTAQAQLALGEKITEVLKQPQYKPIPTADQIVILFMATRGLMDKVPTDQVAAVEQDVLAFMHQEYPDLLKGVNAGESIKTVEAELTEVLRKYLARQFADNRNTEQKEHGDQGD